MVGGAGRAGEGQGGQEREEGQKEFPDIRKDGEGFQIYRPSATLVDSRKQERPPASVAYATAHRLCFWADFSFEAVFPTQQNTLSSDLPLLVLGAVDTG